jgi:hypothetical protein
VRGRDGQIVVGWLLKLVVGLTIFGLILFEAGAVIAARVQADGIAADAAREAAFTYGRDASEEDAKAAALEFVGKNPDALLVAFGVSDDGKRVTVTVEKRAKTIFVQHIGRLKRYSRARATESATVV